MFQGNGLVLDGSQQKAMDAFERAQSIRDAAEKALSAAQQDYDQAKKDFDTAEQVLALSLWGMGEPTGGTKYVVTSRGFYKVTLRESWHDVTRLGPVLRAATPDEN